MSSSISSNAMSSAKFRRFASLLVLLVGIAAGGYAVLFSHSSASASDSVQVNIIHSMTVDANHPAKIIVFSAADANDYSKAQARDITVAEAEAIAGKASDKQSSVRTDVSAPDSRMSPATSSATCHTRQAVVDPVGIELTSVQHDTNWTYNPGVRLNWYTTEAGWHWSTGWEVTSGPNQRQVSSSQTHGDASFNWFSPSGYPHTLNNDNQVASNGSCLGIMQAVGSIPLISHVTQILWITR